MHADTNPRESISREKYCLWTELFALTGRRGAPVCEGRRRCGSATVSPGQAPRMQTGCDRSSRNGNHEEDDSGLSVWLRAAPRSLSRHRLQTLKQAKNLPLLSIYQCQKALFLMLFSFWWLLCCCCFWAQKQCFGRYSADTHTMERRLHGWNDYAGVVVCCKFWAVGQIFGHCVSWSSSCQEQRNRELASRNQLSAAFSSPCCDLE